MLAGDSYPIRSRREVHVTAIGPRCDRGRTCLADRRGAKTSRQFIRRASIRPRAIQYDLRNLVEFASHMRWRLPGRPYAALVLGPETGPRSCPEDSSSNPRATPARWAGIRPPSTYPPETAVRVRDRSSTVEGVRDTGSRVNHRESAASGNDRQGSVGSGVGSPDADVVQAAVDAQG